MRKLHFFGARAENGRALRALQDKTEGKEKEEEGREQGEGRENGERRMGREKGRREEREDHPSDPPQATTLVRKYTLFFSQLFGANGTGLEFSEEISDDPLVRRGTTPVPPSFGSLGPPGLGRPAGQVGPGFLINFKFQLPLYVYTRLSEVVVSREVTPEMLV
jgi:hypothetical protein